MPGTLPRTRAIPGAYRYPPVQKKWRPRPEKIAFSLLKVLNEKLFCLPSCADGAGRPEYRTAVGVRCRLLPGRGLGSARLVYGGRDYIPESSVL